MTEILTDNNHYFSGTHNIVIIDNHKFEKKTVNFENVTETLKPCSQAKNVTQDLTIRPVAHLN